MRILSRYIIKEHVAPFFFALGTITFLLLIDFVPKIIDLVIDKNISIMVVLELIGLNLAWMLALSVPMSVLVATLMAFGRLSSDFEITALKSSGINVLQLLKPVLFGGILVSVGMIWFNDKILPDLNKQARHLHGDISAMRPTLSFKSGVFVSDIPGFLVMVDKIDHATSRVQGVSITDTKMPDKPRIIVADSGYLKMTDNGRNMQFDLYSGEIHSIDLKEPANYRKVDFDNQVINVSDIGSELIRTESEYRTDREMGILEMKEKVDVARQSIAPFRERITEQLHAKYELLFNDTGDFFGKDTLDKKTALTYVKNDAQVFKRHVEKSRQQVLSQERQVNKYSIEIHKKYAIPLASLSFILFGAPLAIIVRRGGMGTAIAISILMFIVYWAFLIGGEDLADRGFLSPIIAMWSANILIGAAGIYLLYLAVTEKPFLGFLRS
ncbi:MAG TPA: LptF/LptG family permease [candidate division Zixibacteria bacterium]|nr:LptF/LptG family permease [candidate division Zixibacteria bacterium]